MVAIEWEGRRAGEMVDFLFDRVPGDGTGSPQATFRVESESGAIQIFKNDRLVCRNDADGPAASVLMDQVVDRLARTSTGGLLLHAAAFTRRGRGIVVPAASQQGKTTLAAWMSAGGFECLTDELVYVPHGSCEIVPLARPLRVRRESGPVLSTRFPRWPPRGRTLTALNTHLIPIAALGQAGERKPARAEIDLIVFSRYDPAGDGRLRPLSGAKAALRLMSSLLNAGNVDGRGVGEAARLARTTAACEIAYSECVQFEAELKRWFDSTGSARHPVTRRRATPSAPA